MVINARKKESKDVFMITLTRQTVAQINFRTCAASLPGQIRLSMTVDNHRTGMVILMLLENILD